MQASVAVAAAGEWLATAERQRDAEIRAAVVAASAPIQARPTDTPPAPTSPQHGHSTHAAPPAPAPQNLRTAQQLATNYGQSLPRSSAHVQEEKARLVIPVFRGANLGASMAPRRPR